MSSDPDYCDPLTKFRGAAIVRHRELAILREIRPFNDLWLLDIVRLAFYSRRSYWLRNWAVVCIRGVCAQWRDLTSKVSDDLLRV